MRLDKDINVDYDKFVEIFNSQGKVAASEFLSTSYNLKYEYTIRMLKKKTDYRFDRTLKKYYIMNQDEVQFLSMDKLLGNKKEEATKVVASIPEKIYYRDTASSLILDLYQDRLTELSKYIIINQSSKSIEIDLLRLRESGYDINIIN